MKKIDRRPLATTILGLIIVLGLIPLGLAAQTGTSTETAKAGDGFEPQPFTLAQMSSLPATRFDDPVYAEAAQSFIPPLPPLDVIGRGGFGDVAFKSTLALNLALNVADFFSTREALSRQGVSEGNPFMKKLVKSPFLFAGVKLGASALSIFLLDRIYKKNKTLGWVMTTITNSLLSYVVANNMRMIATHKVVTGAK
jgi:hypothetical protein